MISVRSIFRSKIIWILILLLLFYAMYIFSDKYAKILQLREDIRKSIFGNVGSVAAFRIGAEDAEFLANQFEPTFGEKDLIKIDNFNAYIKLLINNQTTKPFNFKIDQPVDGSLETAERIKQLSRSKYGRNKSEVDAEIQQRSKIEKPMEKGATVPAEEPKFQ